MSKPTKDDLHLVGLLLYKSHLWQILDKAEGVDVDLKQIDHDLDLFARAISDTRNELKRANKTLEARLVNQELEIDELKVQLANSVHFNSGNTGSIANAAVRALGHELDSLQDRIRELESPDEDDYGCSCCGR